MSDLLKDLAAAVNATGSWDIGSCSVRFVGKHHATIQQNAEDAAKYRNDGSTHADGCYAWGPKHYECALRKLRDDAEAVKEWEEFVCQVEKYLRLNNPELTGSYQEMFDVLLMDAKRLSALERAMSELKSYHRGWHQEIRVLADKILREGEPHDQD